MEVNSWIHTLVSSLPLCRRWLGPATGQNVLVETKILASSEYKTVFEPMTLQIKLCWLSNNYAIIK
jgi:hypothetical protein